MTSRITTAWSESDRIVAQWAAIHDRATFTAIRDIYGRCSFAVENLDPGTIATLGTEVRGNSALIPYLASRDVYVLDPGSPLAATVHKSRRRLGDLHNAFVVERLLANESWTRSPDHNPADWPPVVAFYSFKGGVGRTTTTALTALTLARQGKRVLVVDLDLEAPGIEGYFFPTDSEEGRARAGVVDYLLEREVIGSDYQADMDEFILPYSDALVASQGGSLAILPAGNIRERYMECLGRVNLADIGRKQDSNNPLRLLIRDALAWREVDLVLVDCRTGFTDVGGVTMNGLSNLDVLVFRGGETDRRHLPIVLDHIQRFRTGGTVPSIQEAERLARSFLIVYTMVEFPPKSEDAEQYRLNLRDFTSQACWEKVFKRFESVGYSHPDTGATDSPLEPVAHDVIVIPYLKDFFSVSAVTDMLRIQTERPEQPYEALVRRIVDVKLKSRSDPQAPGEWIPVTFTQMPLNERALQAIERLVGAAAGEQEFTTPEAIRSRFLPRAAYRTLLDPKAFLILGRKGAGKSALFQILTQDETFKQALFQHLNLDIQVINRARWVVGFAQQRGFPESEDFARLCALPGFGPDLAAQYWRNLAAHSLSQSLSRPLPELPDVESCMAALNDAAATKAVRQWMEDLDQELDRTGTFCYLSYDDLDVGVTKSNESRGELISALVDYWQQAMRRFLRLRAKIFLREDIYNRDVKITDKAKIRDGVDRGTITWDGIDIYRVLLKRLGHDAAIQGLWKRESLWLPGFDDMLAGPLGFIPPQDEAWITRCIHTLAGETMASGPSGHKRGYVYSWVLEHISDASDLLRPRYALLLFSEAAKLQARPESKGALLSPSKFREALRGAVSRAAVEDLRSEFREEWSIEKFWLPDQFAAFGTVWPVDEGDLEKFLAKLAKNAGFSAKDIRDRIEHMREAGLLERRTPRGKEPQIQIPDIYLYGLGLTRKGG